MNSRTDVVFVSLEMYPTYSRLSRFILGVWATGVAQFETSALPRRGKSLSSRLDFSSSKKMQPLEPMQSSYESTFPIDDTETRMKIWKLFFEDTPLPESEDHAVEKYYGVLDRFIGKKKIRRGAIERIMEEV